MHAAPEPLRTFLMVPALSDAVSAQRERDWLSEREGGTSQELFPNFGEKLTSKSLPSQSTPALPLCRRCIIYHGGMCACMEIIAMLLSCCLSTCIQVAKAGRHIETTDKHSALHACACCLRERGFHIIHWLLKKRHAFFSSF
jgi:hypothetical protein